MSDFKNMDKKDFLKIFEDTKILRKPLTGYIKGFHLLRYTLIGPNKLKGTGSVCLKGVIQVSPKMILTMYEESDTMADVFGEDLDLVQNHKMLQRSFMFDIAKIRNIKIRSRSFKMDLSDINYQDLLTQTEEEFNKKEIVNRGLIFSPNPHIYPVSIEKFILSILDKEFNL